MISILIALAMQGATPSATPQSKSLPAVGAGVVTNPEWLNLPTGEDMARFYPKRAADEHVEGRAVLRCSVTAAGELADCIVSDETPAAQGFGDAALQLSPMFKMKPITRNGVAVSDGKINLPIQFALPKPETTAASTQEGLELSNEGPKAIKWLSTPGPDIFAINATRYVKGRSGTAVLFCIVAADGRFSGCRVESETAPNMGYGYAAMSMAQYYRMAPKTADGTPVAGGVIRVPVHFIAN